ncbi:MAG: 2-oxo acid dehydrogenase subunit E2 [Bradyrhizobiaceae bacterium]|nr:2-oxo acid dehydrogenase subunit E2 [Bradyrhizobiaceae bacterium]
MSTFSLPDLGEGLQEAEIVSWHVAEGDHVVIDQPLLSVETEKAMVEIPSPKAGHISRLLSQPGERIRVGAPLLAFEDDPHTETGTVVGVLATPGPALAGSPRPDRAAVPGTWRASPAVRARAHALGVDLSSVKPTGPDRSVTMADVEAADSKAVSSATGAPLRGARETMANNMARAWREVAHATLHDEAGVATWCGPQDVTVRLIRAIVAGCRAEPSLNSSLDADSSSLRANTKIDLGVAIDSPDGVFVPVLRDVASSQPQEWRQRIDAVKHGIRDRSLAPADLRGATITLSNFGTIAGRHATLIVMPPQVAILGAGRIGGPPFRRCLPLSLTFDHRAVTGGEAARFLRAVIVDLERPV